MANTKEIGRTGTEVISSQIAEPYKSSTILGTDYLTDWTIDTVDHMLRSDGQVSGVWKAIELAILQSIFDIAPYKASGERQPSPRDVKIAKFIGEQVHEIWLDTLTQLVDYLPYGFALFEPVLAEDHGKVKLDRLAPRLQHTINGWESKNGYLDSVNQYVWDNELETYRDDIWIPGKKILRFTNRQRGSNFEGESFFRGAYKHYLFKDAFYKFVAVGFERFFVGTPIGALPPGATTEQQDAFIAMLKGLRSNEYGYVYFGDVAGDIKLEDMISVLTKQGGDDTGLGILEHIQHHDILIARSMLAQFIALGEKSAGTRALSSDMTDLFLMNLEAITGYICKIMSCGNRKEFGGIKELVDLNFSDVAGYPTWTCGRTKKTDSAALGAVVAQLVQSGAMEPDDTLEHWLRGLFGAPLEKQNPRPVKTITRERTEQAGQAELQEPIKFQDGLRLWRDRFPHEQHVAFEEIRDVLDTSQNLFVDHWRASYNRQIQSIGEKIGPAVTLANLEALYAIEMPFVEELGATFTEISQALYNIGKRDVKKELIRQAGEYSFQSEEEDEDDERKTALFILQGRQAAQRLADRGKKALEAAALIALISREIVTWDEIEERASLLSDVEAREESNFVSSSYTMGRVAAGIAFADLITEQYYSAMLDHNTCEVCLMMDGVAYSERPYQLPNSACLGAQHSKGGGNPCRCQSIYMLVPGTSVSDILE